jgi:hypothetical protein
MYTIRIPICMHCPHCERYDLEHEVEIDVTVGGGEPAQLGGHPDCRRPADDVEVDIIEVRCGYSQRRLSDAVLADDMDAIITDAITAATAEWEEAA